jgi:flagellar assembly protein FliH
MADMTPRKFSFDTVFEGDRVVQGARPKRFYTPEEVEQIRSAAYDEGERSAVALAEGRAADAIALVARDVGVALGALAEVAHVHRSESARLAMAAARKIADAALDRFPDAPAVAALEALSAELQGAPRLVVRVAAEDEARVAPALERAAQMAGFAGQIVVKTDPDFARASFGFDWGDGRASFEAEAAAARVAEALEAALVAEGLHAEAIPHSTPNSGKGA